MWLIVFLFFVIFNIIVHYMLNVVLTSGRAVLADTKHQSRSEAKVLWKSSMHLHEPWLSQIRKYTDAEHLTAVCTP